MSDKLTNFVEAINAGHLQGLCLNDKSYIIGLGVNYPNGADGTTKNLSSNFPDNVLDVPVSEAAFTGMCVGMATSGLNPIVHHGRVEFALLAMDQILTQAAKWNYMFGGNYPCNFSARLNIGRQWGNGPQHTSSYNSLFLNTPGLNILWPATPNEAYNFTKYLHSTNGPSIMMEHRYLYKTTDLINDQYKYDNNIQTAAIYGDYSDTVILTYGDGLVEALKTQQKVTDSKIQVISLSAFINERKVNNELINYLDHCKNLICIDTSNFEFGLMQGFIGNLATKVDLKNKIKIFSPPFVPCATSPKLVKEYYPFSPNIIKYMNEIKITNTKPQNYNFDDINMPANFDFSRTKPSKVLFEKII